MGQTRAETSQRQPRSGSAVATVVIGLVVGVALGVGAFMWWQARPDSSLEIGAESPSSAAPRSRDEAPVPADDESPDQPQTDEPVADETPNDEESAHVVCPADVMVEVCDAAFFVESFRGQPFKRFPVVEFVDDVEFENRLLSDFGEDEEELALTGDIFRSLGLIGADEDLVELFRASLEVGVVGFYRTDTEELLIKGEALDLYAESVVIHELVHAHDDQWFDLSRFDDLGPGVEDETEFGFTSVLEGNAVRVENAWRAQLTADEERQLSQQELSLFDGADLDVLFAIPSVILELQYSPYQDGPVLVDAIAARAGGGDVGEAAVNQAIIDPPQWGEEVLHPELYPDGDQPAAVPLPAARGKVIDSGVVGELLFRVWLGERAATGWNGDRYVTWIDDQDANRVCTAIHVAGDSDRDLDEIEEGLDAWVSSARSSSGEARRVDLVSVDGIPAVRIEGCA